MSQSENLSIKVLILHLDDYEHGQMKASKEYRFPAAQYDAERGSIAGCKYVAVATNGYVQAIHGVATWEFDPNYSAFFKAKFFAHTDRVEPVRALKWRPSTTAATLVIVDGETAKAYEKCMENIIPDQVPPCPLITMEQAISSLAARYQIVPEQIEITLHSRPK
ncbi:hypothetical protein RBH89_13320 [Paracidovorax avenae]